MSIANIVRNQSELAYLWNNDQFQKMTLKQKEFFILNLFHDANFNRLQKQNRVIVLQLLENILACEQGRLANKIIVVDDAMESETEKNHLYDMLVNHQKRQYFVRKSLIEDNRRQQYVNDSVKLVYTDVANLVLLESVVHESWHSTTKQKLDSIDFNIKFLKLPREYKEHILWNFYCCVNGYVDVDWALKNKESYLYLMIPDEYYAFSYSDSYMRQALLTLEKIYGREPKLDQFLLDNSLFKQRVQTDYYLKMHKVWNVEQIYRYYLDLYIKTYCEINEKVMTEKKLHKVLNKSKSLIEGMFK